MIFQGFHKASLAVLRVKSVPAAAAPQEAMHSMLMNHSCFVGTWRCHHRWSVIVDLFRETDRFHDSRRQRADCLALIVPQTILGRPEGLPGRPTAETEQGDGI